MPGRYILKSIFTANASDKTLTENIQTFTQTTKYIVLWKIKDTKQLKQKYQFIMRTWHEGLSMTIAIYGQNI